MDEDVTSTQRTVAGDNRFNWRREKSLESVPAQRKCNEETL